jgi:hypothetical protein
MDIYKYKGWKFAVAQSGGWKVQIRKPSQEAKDIVVDDFAYPENEEGKKEVVVETCKVIDHLIQIERQIR